MYSDGILYIKRMSIMHVTVSLVNIPRERTVLRCEFNLTCQLGDARHDPRVTAEVSRSAKADEPLGAIHINLHHPNMPSPGVGAT